MTAVPKYVYSYQSRPVMTVYRVLEVDPTHTTTLRNAFARDMARRFRNLRGLVRRAIVDQDVFGLTGDGLETMQQGIPLRRAFAFPRNQAKVEAFMRWFREQADRELLQVRFMPQVGRAAEVPWTNMYIEDSYKRGVQRARYELGKAGYPVPSLEETGGISASMSTPFHADRAGLMYSRVFEELKGGVTATMDTQISRVLTQGMIDGDNPRTLARKLNKTISGPVGDLGMTDILGRFIPAERRARMIARTEVIRAHHTAMIQEYENWQLEGVRVKAEWATAGYNVCEECEGLEGQVFTLQEIRGMIPLHPNCRCVALPVDVTDEGKKIIPEQQSDDYIEPPDVSYFSENVTGILDDNDIPNIIDEVNKKLKENNIDTWFGKGGGFTGRSYYTKFRGRKLRISDHATTDKWGSVYGYSDIEARIYGGQANKKAMQEINALLREINILKKQSPVVTYIEQSYWRPLPDIPSIGRAIQTAGDMRQAPMRGIVMDVSDTHITVMIEGRAAPTKIDVGRIRQYWGETYKKSVEAGRS